MRQPAYLAALPHPARGEDEFQCSPGIFLRDEAIPALYRGSISGGARFLAAKTQSFNPGGPNSAASFGIVARRKQD
jgi:hypothetical protein